MADIRTVEETGSTNEDMKRFVIEGAAEGFWLRAENQTTGRGRMGRSWEGRNGNLFASTLVRLLPRDPLPSTLAFVVAVAVHEVLTDFTGEGLLRLKWPNDVIADDAKLCGMLLERVDDAVVIGIGINVESAPELADRRTTCLRDLGAQACEPASLLALLAESFALWLERWRTYGTAPIIRAWLDRAYMSGTPLAVQLPGGERIEGIFETLDDQGALILRLADGRRHVIYAGEVFTMERGG
jgi:BirA family biotin operon repressor/biotin-[acetyl-CoA-carboxylase] ligase